MEWFALSTACWWTVGQSSSGRYLLSVARFHTSSQVVYHALNSE